MDIKISLISMKAYLNKNLFYNKRKDSRKQKLFNIILIISIISFSLFKNPLLDFFHEVIELIFITVKLDYTHASDLIQEFALHKKSKKVFWGWLIYYPVYISFHIFLINLLFMKSIARWISIFLLTTILLCVTIAIIGKVLELNAIHKAAMLTFHNIIGMPFILLLIEGGKILYDDFIKSSKT